MKAQPKPSELDKPVHNRQRPWDGRHQDAADPAKMAAAQAKWDSMLRGVPKVESLARSVVDVCRPDASK